MAQRLATSIGHQVNPMITQASSKVKCIIDKIVTASCSVNFEPAEYLRNDIECVEEQQMAISSGAYYVPLCQQQNTSLYDGCQCEIVDGRTSAVCYCVDPFGNILGAGPKVKVVEGESSWQSVCVNDLKCSSAFSGMTPMQQIKNEGYSNPMLANAVKLKTEIAKTDPNGQTGEYYTRVLVASVIVVVLFLLLIVN